VWLKVRAGVKKILRKAKHKMSSIGGKNYKKIKKAPREDAVARYIVSKSDFPDCIYAKVQSMLGSGRLLALGEDNHTYNCVIRGRLYKKVWIKKDDIVIIDARGFEKAAVAGAHKTADVLHKLSDDEINHNDVNVISRRLDRHLTSSRQTSHVVSTDISRRLDRHLTSPRFQVYCTC
jgi:initiation factor 1A